MTDAEQAAVVKVLCSLALSDHLGDVRDAESGLWELLGVPPLPYDDPAWDSDSAFTIAQARLATVGYQLPDHLRDSEEE